MLEIVLIGISLAMDAFAVSIADGMCYKGLTKGKASTVPLTFALFQAAMPLAGFFLGTLISDYIDKFDHYVAFFLLLIIGGKMVFDGIKDMRATEEGPKEKKFSYPEVLVQGVATSIDAFAVGITMLAMDGITKTNVFGFAALIGVITFVISLIGLIIGTTVGKLFKNKACLAEILGGLVLIGLGIKILVQGIIG